MFKQIRIKDLGKHLLVRGDYSYSVSDDRKQYYIFEKIDNYMLNPKKMEGSPIVPSQVYRTLWSKGFIII